MKLSHTQNKWKCSLNPLTKNKEYIIETISDGKLIARVQSEEVSDEELEGNAKLIALSTDMVQALLNSKREFERLKSEMLKPSGERDSFWISTFIQGGCGGMACLNEINEILNKINK